MFSSNKHSSGRRPLLSEDAESSGWRSTRGGVIDPFKKGPFRIRKCRYICNRVASILRLVILVVIILFLYWKFKPNDNEQIDESLRKPIKGVSQLAEFGQLAARPFAFLKKSDEKSKMETEGKGDNELEATRVVPRTGGEGVMRNRIFHLDLKGAPPRPEVYHKLFPLLHQLNFTGVLFEYEDMFPYYGELEILRKYNAYTKEVIQDIQNLAIANSLDVIPLVQTWGHLEFALKHDIFADLREIANISDTTPILQHDTLCPSEPKAFKLVREMLTQVWLLHPNSRYLHIGSDEAWHVAKDQRCFHALQNEFRNSTERLKLAHIAKVANFAKTELKIESVWAWNDMFGESPVELLNEFKLGDLIVPMVWGYTEDVTRPGYFPDGMFHRYHNVFEEILLAGAFKGANGIAQTFMNTTRYIDNVASYHNLFAKFRPQLADSMSGMVLTGWQRYSHEQKLCELLPVAIPSLVREAYFLSEWNNKPDVLDRRYMEFLHFKPPSEPVKPVPYHGQIFYPPEDYMYTFCDFFGVDLFREIEKLRFLKWRAIVDGNVTEKMREELDQLAKTIKPILLSYFFEDTVNEWILQNLDPAHLPYPLLG